MSVETIVIALRRIFEDKDEQIVIWYDETSAFKDRFEMLELTGVEKIAADRNLFWIKYRIYVEAPKNKYLIYVQGKKPEAKENWLLDVALSFHEFKADESSMNIQELGIDLRLKPLLDKYTKFFRNAKNKTAFASLIEPHKHDDEEDVITKMMAVCAGLKNDTLEDLLYVLFGEMRDEKESKLENLKKYELLSEFWKRVKKQFGYINDDPTLMGLAIYLFNNRFKLCIKDPTHEGNKNASLFVNHWMQHVKYSEVFKALSLQIDEELQIKQTQLKNLTLETLSECDTYESIEHVFIKELVHRLKTQSLNASQIAGMIDLRKAKFWYNDFAGYYEALTWASEFLFLKASSTLEVKSFEQGVSAYTQQWYRFDYAYRKYLYALSRCSNGALFDEITIEIEKFYANTYLMGLSDGWYERLRDIDTWVFDPAIDQKRFFDHHVKPNLGDNKKLCIIISDALRYESGKELDERFSKENNFRTEFTHMIASLPSYTQIGMASLLPHKELSYKEGKFEVYADGISTQGTANRTKILQSFVPESIAMQASDFLAMKRDDARAFFKPYNLVYIYENSIDSRGKPPTEDQVFEATEECFDRLMRLTKKLQNELMWRNVFITADHGYLYEKTNVDESNFCQVPKDERWSDSNKRMAIGNNLEDAPCVLKYNAAQLNVSGDTEFLIAKSMQRIRSKGGGSKFVHGGATLQEIIIPLIKINRNTELKSAPVDFDVIRSSGVISTNLLPVTFLQKEPVGDKTLPQCVQVSICNAQDEIISDVHEINFESKEKDPAKMHQKITFHFIKDLTSLNGQTVTLRIMTKALGTNDFNKELSEKRDSYTINISLGVEEW